jgi:hypothetical protein
MAILAKTIESTSPLISNDTATTKPSQLPLNPKLKRVRESVEKGDYQRALGLLPADSRDLEILNSRAVCLMRLGRFEQAFTLLRSSVLHLGTLAARAQVPDHMKINFATALFYGGHPSGALDMLAEIRREDDVAVKQLRQATAQWVAEMGWLRRLDWKLNRIDPKKLPTVPQMPVGRFSWEVT